MFVCRWRPAFGVRLWQVSVHLFGSVVENATNMIVRSSVSMSPEKKKRRRKKAKSSKQNWQVRNCSASIRDPFFFLSFLLEYYIVSWRHENVWRSYAKTYNVWKSHGECRRVKHLVCQGFWTSPPQQASGSAEASRVMHNVSSFLGRSPIDGKDGPRNPKKHPWRLGRGGGLQDFLFWQPGMMMIMMMNMRYKRLRDMHRLNDTRQ